MRLVAIGKAHGHAQRQDGKLAGIKMHCISAAKVYPVAIGGNGEFFNIGVVIANEDG